MKNNLLSEDLKKKHQIFTPNKIVEKMLNIACESISVELYECNILENSCGNGNILSVVIECFITKALEADKSLEEIKNMLECNIHGYEIDIKLIKDCKEKLNDICAKYFIYNICWDIKNEDYLRSDSENYDLIIGNPPYISYSDLPKDKRIYLKETFSSCSKGKFDYDYAFIEKSLMQLNDKGVLLYIIPSNIFKNVFANDLRKLIINDIVEIIDYPEEKVFEDVLVSPAIIKIVKGSKSKTIKYSNNSKKLDIEKSNLKDKWIFSNDIIVSEKRLGDYYRVSSSVATLFNKAFIVKNGMINGEYYEIDGYKIELSLLKKAASPKNMKSNKNEYIIFPYSYDNCGNLIRYSEEQMREKYPYGMNYLESFKEKLDKRDSDKGAKWFEFGRSQALKNINQKLVLISSVISKSTKSYLLSNNEVPYSGLYIRAISDASLDELIVILNSERFKNYIKDVGVCVSGSSKRVSPKDIENYMY